MSWIVQGISMACIVESSRDGGLPDASFPRTRETRLGLHPMGLDTRLRGYDGTRVIISTVKTLLLRVFSKKDTKSTKLEIGHCK